MWRAPTRSKKTTFNHSSVIPLFPFTLFLRVYLCGVCLYGAYILGVGGAGLAWAQAAAPAVPPATNPYQFILGTVNFFLLAFFVYYVLMLRPQQLKQDEQSRFLKDLKRDDEVITSGGIIGKVAAINPEFITIDAGSGAKLCVKSDHVFAHTTKGVAKKTAGAAK